MNILFGIVHFKKIGVKYKNIKAAIKVLKETNQQKI